MHIDFPDEALGALVVSQAALEAAHGQHAIKVMLCFTLLVRCRCLADLLRFAFLRVLTVSPADGGPALDITHRGVGLRVQPLDSRGRVLAQWTDVKQLDVERVAVVALTGAAVTTHRMAVR